MGIRPEPQPAVKAKLTELWGEWSQVEAMNTDQMMVNMKKEEINGCMVIGCNQVMLYPDREFAVDALESLDFLVVADLFENETTALADVVLPLASWAEYDGYYVNLEGRIQLAGRALPSRFESKPGFEIAELIAGQFEGKLFESIERRDEQIHQVLKASESLPLPENYFEVRAATPETGGDYPIALYLGDDAHHSGHLSEKSTSLSNFCGEVYIEMSPALAESLGLTEGDSARVESQVGKVIAPVKLSRHITNDAVFMPRNFSAAGVNSLLMRKKRVDWVKISKVVG